MAIGTTRRVRHDVADGVRLMAFAPASGRCPQLGSSVVLAVLISIGLGQL
ncbi:MAG: hypothetical protein ABWX74_17575 [Aeromicrobium sp.]